MTVAVIDTSALAAVVFHEPAGAALMEQCRALTLHAPGLLDYEMANVCLVKQRRHPDRTEQFTAQFEAYLRLDLRHESVDIRKVRALAEQTGLTAYDAAYLWLARKLKGDLVTLDQRLHTAWLTLEPPGRT
jgi:predicted nucleic acid-binding protein